MKRRVVKIITVLLLFFCFQTRVQAADEYCEYTYKGAVLKVYNISDGYGAGLFNPKLMLKTSISTSNVTGQVVIKTEEMHQSYFGINDTFDCKPLKIKKGVQNDCNGPGSQCTTYTFTTEGSSSDETVTGKSQADTNSCTYNSKDKQCTLNVTYDYPKNKVSFKVTSGECEVSLKQSDFFDSNNKFKCRDAGDIVTELCTMAEGVQVTTFHVAGKSTCDGGTTAGTSGGNQTTESPSIDPPAPEIETSPTSSVKKCVSCGDGTLKDIPAQLPLFARNCVKVFQLMVPVILVILGIIDFVRAVIASDEKMMAESQKRFIKRIAAGVLIFFVVAIVRFVFGLIDGNLNVLGCVPCFISDSGSCGAEYTCPDRKSLTTGINSGGESTSTHTSSGNSGNSTSSTSGGSGNNTNTMSGVGANNVVIGSAVAKIVQQAQVGA